mmetsp:Transcript_6425/g.15534  ORF Transcript_6425/g.15534 Transcript_6425/m.15534 type:complete len:437 (-) Transcript_6425:396-1706(-)|eukprot:CAMPEP_0114517686 /NCGR_PEP_ID=MMETSP0109-20121206/18031_1 /TAXON_ID=29199 /ORGANISM="Chlorarachnion reptans, Strain CCCM449" /LENGTH=436 /DNA_ID=CAMNT_0001698233 /DNA_START=201 /DNA_END=1511 /DNA_ORIENTATION=-
MESSRLFGAQKHKSPKKNSKTYGSLEASYGNTVLRTGSNDLTVVDDAECNLPKSYGKVKGDYLVLEIQTKISFIEDLDIVNGTFFVKCFMETSWYDDKFLKWCISEKKHEGKPKPVKISDDLATELKLWKPKIKFKNTSKALMPENYGTVDAWAGDPKTGLLTMRTAYQGRATCVLDLRAFPFDRHDLIISWHFMNKDRRLWLVDDAKITTGKVQVRSQEWELIPFEGEPILVERGWSDPEDSTSGNVYPAARGRVRIARYYKYYLYNTVLIVILITLMTLGAVCCDPSDLGDRLNVTLTVMLTTVAIKWTIDDRIPNVPYLTIIDKFLIEQMCVVYLMFLLNCIVAKLVAKLGLSDEEVQHFDDWCGIIWFIAYSAGLGHFAWSSYTARRKEPNILMDYLINAEELDYRVPEIYREGNMKTSSKKIESFETKAGQ